MTMTHMIPGMFLHALTTVKPLCTHDTDFIPRQSTCSGLGLVWSFLTSLSLNSNSYNVSVRVFVKRMYDLYTY